MTIPATNELSIAAVERETGLSKDTLRVWERRYNFPEPGRDAFGERSYPPDQVEKLRLIRSLMDQGYRPGKIVGADIDALREMAGKGKDAPGTVEQDDEARPDLRHYIALCKAHETEALRRELSQSLMREGMYRFVIDVIAPLNALVGSSWANGRMAVFEEHLYTECVQTVMRNAIAAIPLSVAAPSARPRVLLTTVPQEQHGLGLLMSEAIFAIEGARCISLGTQTPVGEIVRAAEAQSADIVALSFSAAARPAQVLEALTDLRAGLPPHIEIWAGGQCSVLQRRPPPQINVLDLHGIGAMLEAWRTRHLS